MKNKQVYCLNAYSTCLQSAITVGVFSNKKDAVNYFNREYKNDDSYDNAPMVIPYIIDDPTGETK